ncbi:MAG: hypothetical protein HY814_14420 [Candidatus Riflebacteria bacterium]|nr:hypothetical protein [Candidatus Riflebacteria bacterium]
MTVAACGARPGRLLVVSHCILNPLTVVRGLQSNREASRTLLEWALAHDVALAQMPCPEFCYAGAERTPRTREGYEVPDFEALCRELGAGVVRLVRQLAEAGHRVLGIVGVEGSPSCGVALTTRGAAGGEMKVAEPGLYTVELVRTLAAAGLRVPYIGLPRRAAYEGPSDWLRVLDGLLPEE